MQVNRIPHTHIQVFNINLLIKNHRSAFQHIILDTTAHIDPDSTGIEPSQGDKRDLGQPFQVITCQVGG